MVARVVWDHEVAGSIPVTSTKRCNRCSSNVTTVFYYTRPYMRIYVHLQPSGKKAFFNYDLSKPHKINQKLVFSLFFSLLHKKIGEKKLKSSKYYLYQAKLLFFSRVFSLHIFYDFS